MAERDPNITEPLTNVVVAGEQDDDLQQEQLQDLNPRGELDLPHGDGLFHSNLSLGGLNDASGERVAGGVESPGGSPRALPVSPGAYDVLAERSRHVTGEGWDARHDAAWTRSELVRAAQSYLAAVRWRREDPANMPAGRPIAWPWDWRWWKPRDDRRDLVRAAALIIAEIDRIDRAADRRPASIITGTLP